VAAHIMGTSAGRPGITVLKPLRSRVGPQPFASNHLSHAGFQSECTLDRALAGQAATVIEA
jgi:hypothetical protein